MFYSVYCFFLKAIFKPPLPQHQFKTVTRFNETCHFIYSGNYSMFMIKHMCSALVCLIHYWRYIYMYVSIDFLNVWYIILYGIWTCLYIPVFTVHNKQNDLYIFSINSFVMGFTVSLVHGTLIKLKKTQKY